MPIYLSMEVIVGSNVTVQVGRDAAHTFQLQSSMGDPIIMEECFTDRRLNLGPLTNGYVIGQDMSGERPQAARDGPDMQVMHAADTLHMQNVGQHCIHVNIGGGGFHQNIDRLLQDAPGIPKDQQANKDADQRVKPVQTGKMDDDPGYDSPDVERTSPIRCT